MGLGIILASATPTPRKSSSSSGHLSTTDLGIILGVVGLLLILLAVGAWIASRDWRHRRRFRRGRPPRRRFRQRTLQAPALSLAVRSAFARGDYMAVIDVAQPEMAAPTRLLLAQSYARIGADVLAANTASQAITDILTAEDWSDAEPTKGFSVLEERALRSWLDRLDGVDLGSDPTRLEKLRTTVLGTVPDTPEESVQLSIELDEMRQRVAAERTAEQTSSSNYRWVNLIAGTLAGGLAAASGVAGVAKGPPLLTALLAFVSAAITAVLTTLKPAEREKESKVRADALGQLAASIDLFDVDRPRDALDLLPAVKDVHERLAVAEGRGKIVPLVAGSKSTSTRRPTVTAITPTSGKAVGGTVVTITGTGFVTGATVAFGGTAAKKVTFASATTIKATAPPGTAGTSVDITVTTPGGTSSKTSAAKFQY